MLLKGAAALLGLGTISWSSISLLEMTSLMLMLSLPYGVMPLLNDDAVQTHSVQTDHLHSPRWFKA